MRHKYTWKKILAVCGIMVFSTLQVLILNTDSTYGEHLTSIREKIDTMESENIMLNQKIASASAIATISVKARNMGMDGNTSIVSLSYPLPIAQALNQSL